MKNVEVKQLERLKKYIDTFHISLSSISEELGLDKSTVGKYFNAGVPMKVSRYFEILDYLRKQADEDELQLYLINNWLKIETAEERKHTLKYVSEMLKTVSLGLDEIIGN